jgi:hypothetical protein
MYAYSKESRPANASAGRVSKRLPPNSSILWGGKETNGQTHTRLHRISTSACAKVAAAVAEVEEAWGGSGAGAVDNVRVGKHDVHDMFRVCTRMLPHTRTIRL